MDNMGDDAVLPIGLAYLAAVLEENLHRVTVIDGPGEALDVYFPLEGVANGRRYGLRDKEVVARIPADTKFIGVTVMFSMEWLPARGLINLIREQFPEVTIIAGGEHITALPEYCIQDCAALDYCVLGEGEQTINELVEAVESSGEAHMVEGLCLRRNGDAVRTKPRARLRSIDELPRPAWHLLPVSNYLDKGVMSGINFGRSMPILASRGCPYRCTFCSNPVMWGPLWRVREPIAVIDEIMDYMAKYDATNFDFYDLTAIVKKKWIVEFCSLIIERGLKITWQFPSGTRSEALDNEVTRLLYESGCKFITYAPESGSDAMLKQIKKQISKPKMLLSMRDAVRNGLNVKANFILGFPAETVRHALETFGFIFRMALIGIKDVSVFPFSPYPGTELFDGLRQSGEITLNDTYFRDLSLGTASIPGSDTSAFKRSYSLRTLRYLCLFGIALFYATSYLTRPKRFFVLVRNLINKKQESRLERALLILLARRARQMEERAN